MQIEDPQENYQTGFIKLFRSFEKWEWYKDQNTKDVFIHLLIKANYKDTKYRGIVIKRGQIMTGLHLLSKELMLTVRKIRTALKHLKTTNEVTIKTSTQGSIIQLVNYDSYQSATIEATNERQSSDNQVTTNNNDNNDNNKRGRPESTNEVKQYFLKQNLPLSKSELEAEKFFNHYEAIGWLKGSGLPIQSWQHTALSWMSRMKDFNKDEIKPLSNLIT